MTNGQRGAAGIAVLLAAIFGYSRFVKPEAAAPPAPKTAYAFDMCIAHGPTAKAAHQVWSDAVLSGVVRTLNDGERASLEEALGVAATRWEARANPLLEDLEGGDPDAEIGKWFKNAPTFVRTAQASAKMRVCAPDGFCVVPRALGAGCPAESAPPESEKDADRARFLLWPWGHALRYRAPSREAARAAAAALRDKVRGSQAIAIVLTKEDADVTKEPPFKTMRERWRKVAGLSAIARKEPTEPPKGAFAVEQADDEVIVLPRHEALSAKDPDGIIESEVLATAPTLKRASAKP